MTINWKKRQRQSEVKERPVCEAYGCHGFAHRVLDGHNLCKKHHLQACYGNTKYVIDPYNQNPEPTRTGE